MKTLIAFITLLSINSYAVGPCRGDVEKYCKDVDPGQGRIIECLKSNQSNLTQECQAHVEQQKAKMKSNIKDIAEACQSDREKFCADIQGGKGRIMKCLKSNRDQLSEACRAELPEKRKNRK